MAITLTESSGSSFGEGWKNITISQAKLGDFNGSKFIDLWFEDYPETLKCRIWEAKGQDGIEFSMSNMIRSTNPDILEEGTNDDGKRTISVDDTPASLKGKKLQVLFYKNENGYAEVCQKVAPAAPFQNAIDNYTEDRIANIKASAEKYQENRKPKTATTAEDSPF